MRNLFFFAVALSFFLSFPGLVSAQLQTNSNTVQTKVGNPQSQPSQTISWAAQISSALQTGYDGSFDKLPTSIIGPSYTAQPVSGTDSSNKYWCTYLVVDAFNLAGFSGTSRANQGGAVNLMNYFRGNSGYKFLDYHNGDHSSVLSQVQPGYAVFYQEIPGSTSIQSLDHAAIVKSISINTHGDGTIETYDANLNGIKTVDYPVSGWTVQGLLPDPPTYSLMGFGTTN